MVRDAIPSTALTSEKVGESWLEISLFKSMVPDATPGIALTSEVVDM